MKIKSFIVLPLAALVLLNGCTKDKQVYDLIAKLEARIEKLEKIVTGGKEEPAGQTSAFDVPVGDSYVLGNPNAKVNIVVFSNFQCPYCARADNALRELVKEESLKDTINIAFKHFPFERHPQARPASKAALAAGEQGKFWEMAKVIFSHQSAMNDPKFDAAKSFDAWAKEAGLDVAKFNKDLKDHDQKFNEMIDKDIKLGADNAKLEGTPWILVNGWLLDGEINAATIKKMMEDKKIGS